jgi:mannose-1-phosphate guanylyltransferase
MQILINAGGTGTRLWPATTPKLPKQFIKLIDDETLLQKTYRRLLQKFNKDQIWVNTNLKFRETVKQNLPQIDENKILCEPEKRDTYASICAHSALVASFTNSNEPLVFVHSDHQIPEQDWQIFNNTIEKLGNPQNQSKYNLLGAGIKPNFASTQFGYIELSETDKQNVFDNFVPLVSFKEKPNQEVATQFFESQNYLWNLGYFAFSFEKLSQIIGGLYPQDLQIFEQIKTDGYISQANYQKLPKTSFDIAVVEKTQNIGVIGMPIAWQDLGNWQVLAEYMPQIPDISNANHSFQIQINGQNNKAKTTNTNRKVAFIGVSDLVLVETEEGILVLDPKQAGAVKEANNYFENLD